MSHLFILNAGYDVPVTVKLSDGFISSTGSNVYITGFIIGGTGSANSLYIPLS